MVRRTAIQRTGLALLWSATVLGAIGGLAYPAAMVWLERNTVLVFIGYLYRQIRNPDKSISVSTTSAGWARLLRQNDLQLIVFERATVLWWLR
jgi:hypothetical protein